MVAVLSRAQLLGLRVAVLDGQDEDALRDRADAYLCNAEQLAVLAQLDSIDWLLSADD